MPPPRTIDLEAKPERAVLVGIQHPDRPKAEGAALLAELGRLCDTLGLQAVELCLVPLREINPKYYVGTGKAAEIAARAKELDAGRIVFDEVLTPTQQRNWEKLAEIDTSDRQEIILDIFRLHAHSREAMLQVELARLKYFLPRLIHASARLEQQRGGAYGSKGAGEKKLELDRRVLVDRIAVLKKELKDLAGRRQTLRKKRLAVPVPTAALVGYTNAGKSSLMNAVTGAGVLVEDKLFATLDSCTRRFPLEKGQEALLTDTVGFIRKLPHGLVEAFKSTLEEVVLADVLLLVLDASDPEADIQETVTRTVLGEIGAVGTGAVESDEAPRPMILVYNKIDLCSALDRDLIRQKRPGAALVSAMTGEGLDSLREAMKKAMAAGLRAETVLLPIDRYDLVSLIHREAQILGETYEDQGVRITARFNEKVRGKVENFLVD